VIPWPHKTVLVEDVFKMEGVDVFNVSTQFNPFFLARDWMGCNIWDRYVKY